MRALTGLIFLLILFQITYAQPPEILWTRDYGGAGNEQGLAIVEPAEGGLCFVGNEASFDAGATDGWIVLMNEEGEEIWSANFGGAGYDRFADVEQLEDGWIVAGYNGSMGNVRFEFWLMKIDNDGNMVWQQFYGGADHERGSSVLRTPDGGFLITGSTFSFGNGANDGWVVKTDADGRLEWSQAYGGGGADAIDNAIAVGEDEYMLFGATTSDGAGGYDHWMIHINGEGEVINEWTYGGENNDHCYGQILNQEGQFILVGTTDQDGNEQYDVVMRCVNIEGEELWNRIYEGEANERCFGVVETVNSGYLLAGATGPYTDENADNWIIRTDADGEVLWDLTYGEDRGDVTRGVIQTTDGGFAVIGWSYSFGNGEGQAWLAKIDTELTGVLDGFVFDRIGNQPLDGVFVETTFGQSTQSDEEGYWIIDRAYAGEFEMTASVPGFNNMAMGGLALEAEDTVSVVFRMTHPEFAPSIEEFDQVLAIGGVAELDLSVQNTGNGPLEWSVSTGLRGDANAEPWTLRRSHLVGAQVEDGYIYGVVFANDLYYVSGAHDGNPQIYIFNTDGELVNSFDQPGDDARGFKDLAFDGELIWGAVVNTIYGITLEGEVITQFESPHNPSTVLTW
ncbi:MAG: carboxypeptidase regulatory-like domain-containing protein, partial [Calditrichaeota bacterium]|nr:carboxypeptidase regulatory-like domain-containing protein [Calditrichota bacterium]